MNREIMAITGCIRQDQQIELGPVMIDSQDSLA
jgi:hypothetical protein